MLKIKIFLSLFLFVTFNKSQLNIDGCDALSSNFQIAVDHFSFDLMLKRLTSTLTTKQFFSSIIDMIISLCWGSKWDHFALQKFSLASYFWNNY